MARLIVLHGLVPVPVDVRNDGGVEAGDVAALVTPRTRVVIVAQLFGARYGLREIAEVVRGKGPGVVLVEDCAQAFAGVGWMGSQEADISLFSFGPIKTCSALGGAIATVRRPELLKRMQEIQDAYPVQREGVFGKRVAKYAALKAVSDSRWLYGLFVAGMEMGEWDVHATITALGKSLRPGVGLKEQVRVRPSAALLDLLLFRLRGFDTRELESRRERVVRLVGLLPKEVRPIGWVEGDGEEGWNHHYWIFPVRVRDPGMVIKALWKEGFDSADGGTSLCVIGAGGGDVDRKGEGRPKRAEEIMREVVYLPIDHDFDDHELERLAGVLRESYTW